MIMDLENIVRELTPGLLRYCTARTRDRSLAEEIAQESLVALITRWNRHGAPESPQAFLFAIARRKAARAMLSRRLLLPLQILVGSRDNAPDPEEAALRGSEYTTLARALEQLPARDREALLIVAVGGLKTEEAARVLGISESALKMRTLRARQRLHALMEDGNEYTRRQRARTTHAGSL
jgi:RNA polymerase sigma-70 factor, ECF subfamily